MLQHMDVRMYVHTYVATYIHCIHTGYMHKHMYMCVRIILREARQ